MPKDTTPPNLEDKVDPDAMERARAEEAARSRTRKRKESHDNTLESIGKAVSAPVLGAADEDPDDPAKP
jgi:muconolactone delta-isomerase